MTLPLSPLLAQDGHGAVEVNAAVHHDVSLPLSAMAASSPRTANHRQKPLHLLPQNQVVDNGPDGALQTSSGPLVSTLAGLNFAGVGNGDYGFAPNAAPPDPNGAVGATQYVQWVNESYAVFDKLTGALVLGPVSGNAVWLHFGGGCEANNDGDPLVQYDKAANRWILTQFSVTNASLYGYLQCVAVSTTPDATGTYNRYAFSYGKVQFIDYPKLGVWPDAYYISYNIFNNGTTFAGPKVCAFNRAAMLTGAAATQHCFQLSTSYGGLLPSDLDGITPPPVGAPNYFLSYGTNSLNQWKFHADFAVPANTTLTGPFTIPVPAFTPACGGGGNCIPQPGTTNKLASLADRLMFRLAYRNRGGTETLVVNHTVKVSGTRREVDGVRWYELRNPNGATGASLFQSGTFSPDSNSRWMGSIAMDKNGNIALGYSASGSTLAPAIRYTGRLSTDPLGTLQAETTLKAGAGSQNANLQRWGDYTDLTVDPVDDCTFWYTNEYLKATGSFNWSTQIASFKFPGCI